MATFKSKPITIIVEEDDMTEYDLTDQMKSVLDQRLMEAESEYLTGKKSIELLQKNMGYKILLSPNAQKEIEKAIDFYSLHSTDAPIHFIESVSEGYDTLLKNRFFSVRF
jgi:ribosomal protein L30E